MGGSRHQFLAREAPDEESGRSVERAHLEVDAPEAPCEGAHERLLHLVRTIEADIIPRLVLAHRSTRGPGPSLVPPIADVRPTDEDVAEVARLSVEAGVPATIAYAEALLARGVSIEVLFLDVLAPAARYLGERWSDDSADFSDVTVGLCRLQQILREYTPAFHDADEAAVDGRRVLLAPAFGEQHTFGALMVGEFFRRAGWDVYDGPLASQRALDSLVAVEWFAVVGFSVGGETRLANVRDSIAATRAASRNRAVGIMVGGPLILARPELVEALGADATASDGRAACAAAESLRARAARDA